MLRRLLWRMNKAGGGPRKLASLTPDQLEAVFNLEAIAQEWQAWAPKLSEVCQIADGRTGGVNVGDRRALFYLARAFAPRASWKSAPMWVRPRFISPPRSWSGRGMLAWSPWMSRTSTTASRPFGGGRGWRSRQNR